MKSDVVIVGGGVSGTVAAIACARSGVKTLLVERYGFCGGSLTNAGVGPMMTFHAGSKQVIAGIAQEIVDRLKKMGASPGHIEDTTGYASSVTPFDGEALKLILDKMLEEANCEVLYHAMLLDCIVNENSITNANFVTRNNQIDVESSYWVDATGDGVLFSKAGTPYECGRPHDLVCQPMTMNARLSSVNIEMIKTEIRDSPERFRIKDITSIDRAVCISVAGYESEVRRAKSDKRISFDRECVLFFETPHPGEVILNMSRINMLDPTDPWALSYAEKIGRKQVWEAFTFLRENIPAFKNCNLVATGIQVGIRESRRMIGCYQLSAKDIQNSKKFPDVIALGGYPIDIHNPVGNDTFTTHLKPGQVYEIPYRSLIPQKTNNLIVAGRCISATHEACAAIRVSPIAMAIGQAAGIAAALCKKLSCHVQDLPVDQLQSLLRYNHAIID